MNRRLFTISVGLAGIFLSTWSFAHFGMLIPSKDVVSAQDPKEIALLLQFTHPFAGGPQMQMDKPEQFGVIMDGKVTDLLETLKEKKVDGQSTWETSYKITRPGDYIFFTRPKPYWERTEEKFIVHVTKVIVDAMGAEEGWDKPIAESAGIPIEIVPRVKPYGLYAGNIFSGQALKGGKPLADTNVEMEWWGKGKTKAPTPAHVTQVVKTDDNGVFSFAMPKAGWWGFSALTEAEKGIQADGKEKKVELAGVIWVYAHPMQ